MRVHVMTYRARCEGRRHRNRQRERREFFSTDHVPGAFSNWLPSAEPITFEFIERSMREMINAMRATVPFRMFGLDLAGGPDAIVEEQWHVTAGIGLKPFVAVDRPPAYRVYKLAFPEPSTDEQSLPADRVDATRYACEALSVGEGARNSFGGSNAGGRPFSRSPRSGIPSDLPLLANGEPSCD
jgi:hypothetical protein